MGHEKSSAIAYLAALSRSLGFRIEIVHLTVDGEKDRARLEKETAFTVKVADKYNSDISFKEVRAKP